MIPSGSSSEGGPAFPRPFSKETPPDKSQGELIESPEEAQEGMSLRDWFAGMALTGLCDPLYNGQAAPVSEVAEIAYALADAMLEARRNVEF